MTEVQRVVPEVVHENAQGLLSVNYIELIPILINALNQLAQQQRTDTSQIRAELAQLNEQLRAREHESQVHVPDETIERIFFFADWKTLMRCCSVSKGWHKILSRLNSLWQRVIESDWSVELVQKPDALTWYTFATKLGSYSH